MRFLTLSLLLLILSIYSSGYCQTWVKPGNYAQVETPIAINPTNPHNLIGAVISLDNAQNQKYVGYYYTFNGGSGGEIALKDPWWIYYNDPPYGIRNQGMAAQFDTSAAPWTFSPNDPVDEHMGLFLNEGGPDPNNPNPPYYSVQAPSQLVTVNGKEITFDLESWSATGADITYPTANPTPVIFRQNNATLTANLKGRRTSDTPEATAGNNGRKITYHWADASTRKPYLVYEDRGNIYSASQNAPG